MIEKRKTQKLLAISKRKAQITSTSVERPFVQLNGFPMSNQVRALESVYQLRYLRAVLERAALAAAWRACAAVLRANNALCNERDPFKTHALLR